jgi:hypothetical protein
MKGKTLVWPILLALLFSFQACQKKKEPEKKAEEKRTSGGFLINFKPNDSPDLIPANSFYIQQSSAKIVGGQPRPVPTDEKKEFCLDVIAKEINPAAAASFQLNYDPELVQYRSFKPGDVFEKSGRPSVEVGLKGGEKGKLAVKVSLGSGTAQGSGRLITLCFQAEKAARADMLFENGELGGAEKEKISGVNWIGGLLWILEEE